MSVPRPTIPGAVSHPAVSDLRWLVRLRWVAAAGQFVTILAVHWSLEVAIPVAALLLVVGLVVVTNLLAQLGAERWFGPRAGRRLVGPIMLLDLTLLTTLLYLTGGTTNPFAVFYFVNLGLAAILLPPRWVLSLLVVAVVSYAVLVTQHRPLPVLEDGGDAIGWSLAEQGQVVAFSTCAAVVVWFIARVTTALRAREAQLRQADRRRAQSDKLEALATLAAGAAHELSTPLSTVAVIAKELTNQVDDPAVREDLTLLRSEVGRCRAILDRMAADAGQAVGEKWEYVTLGQLVEATIGDLPAATRAGIRVTGPGADRSLRFYLPLTLTAQSLRGLLNNGRDASPPDVPVEWTWSRESLGDPAADGLRLTFRDRGRGMDAATLARAGEPFYTTKRAGEGMGLGLFLARNVVERLGGELRIDSAPGVGTSVHVRLAVVPPDDAKAEAEA